MRSRAHIIILKKDVAPAFPTPMCFTQPSYSLSPQGCESSQSSLQSPLLTRTQARRSRKAPTSGDPPDTHPRSRPPPKNPRVNTTATLKYTPRALSARGLKGISARAIITTKNIGPGTKTVLRGNPRQPPNSEQGPKKPPYMSRRISPLTSHLVSQYIRRCENAPVSSALQKQQELPRERTYTPSTTFRQNITP